MRLALPVSVLSAAILMASVAAQTASEPVTVSLAFAWPPGLEISVSSKSERTRLDETRSTRTAISNYTLRVDTEGDNLRIRVEDPDFQPGGDLEGLPAQAQAQMVTQVADLMPDFVVAAETGEFLGLHDLPDFQARLRKFLAEFLPQDDLKVVEQVQGLLTSEAFLTSRAAQRWNALVGTWSDVDFELGAQYTYSSKEPIAAFPGEEILMDFLFSAKRLVPCRRGGVERSCVELEMISTADSEDSKRLIQSLMSKLGGDLPERPVFQSMEIENTIFVVTEPESLIPHSCKLTRNFRGSIMAGGKEQDFQQVEVTEISYTYPGTGVTSREGGPDTGPPFS